MSECIVSVIIPVYNVEKYLDDCLASVCTQTMKEIEIILVDDGSTDSSAEICKKWADKDLRMRFISQPNQGVSVARNTGIKASRGEWIAFIDSDDWIDPDYLEKLYGCAVKNNADISICGFYFNYPDSEVKRGHYENDMLFKGRDEVSQIQIQILAKNMSRIKNNSGDRIGAPWCKLFKASFIHDNRLEFVPGLRRSQDVVFNLYALEKAQFVAYTNIPLYHYRIIEESVCNKFSAKILTNVKAYLGEMQRFLQKYHSDDSVFKDALNTKICTSVYKCLFQYFFNEQYPSSYKQMKKELLEYLSDLVFKCGIEQVKYKNLDMAEKVFVFCLKHRWISALYALVSLRQKFIKVLRH